GRFEGEWLSSFVPAESEKFLLCHSCRQLTRLFGCGGAEWAQEGEASQQRQAGQDRRHSESLRK
ncbi:MAG: hypothetical protein EBZ13_11290, partial [Planctomycetia bacterium]|nr:hypothetical protein [Planctomycetia bacterium]